MLDKKCLWYFCYCTLLDKDADDNDLFHRLQCFYCHEYLHYNFWNIWNVWSCCEQPVGEQCISSPHYAGKLCPQQTRVHIAIISPLTSGKQYMQQASIYIVIALFPLWLRRQAVCATGPGPHHSGRVPLPSVRRQLTVHGAAWPDTRSQSCWRSCLRCSPFKPIDGCTGAGKIQTKWEARVSGFMFNSKVLTRKTPPSHAPSHFHLVPGVEAVKGAGYTTSQTDGKGQWEWVWHWKWIHSTETTYSSSHAVPVASAREDRGQHSIFPLHPSEQCSAFPIQLLPNSFRHKKLLAELGFRLWQWNTSRRETVPQGYRHQQPVQEQWSLHSSVQPQEKSTEKSEEKSSQESLPNTDPHLQFAHGQSSQQCSGPAAEKEPSSP